MRESISQILYYDKEVWTTDKKSGLISNDAGGGLMWYSPSGYQNGIDSWNNSQLRIYSHSSAEDSSYGAVWWQAGENYDLNVMRATVQQTNISDGVRYTIIPYAGSYKLTIAICTVVITLSGQTWSTLLTSTMAANLLGLSNLSVTDTHVYVMNGDSQANTAVLVSAEWNGTTCYVKTQANASGNCRINYIIVHGKGAWSI